MGNTVSVVEKFLFFFISGNPPHCVSSRTLLSHSFENPAMATGDRKLAVSSATESSTPASIVVAIGTGLHQSGGPDVILRARRLGHGTQRLWVCIHSTTG